MEEAMRLNPFHPLVQCSLRDCPLYSLRRYAEAAQALKRMPTAEASGRERDLRPVTASWDGLRRPKAESGDPAGQAGLLDRPSSCAERSA